MGDGIRIVVVGRTPPEMLFDPSPKKKSKNIFEELFELLDLDPDEDFNGLSQHVPELLFLVEPNAERIFDYIGINKTKKKTNLEKLQEMIARERLELLKLEKKQALGNKYGK